MAARVAGPDEMKQKWNEASAGAATAAIECEAMNAELDELRRQLGQEQRSLEERRTEGAALARSIEAQRETLGALRR